MSKDEREMLVKLLEAVERLPEPESWTVHLTAWNQIQELAAEIRAEVQETRRAS